LAFETKLTPKEEFTMKTLHFSITIIIAMFLSMPAWAGHHQSAEKGVIENAQENPKSVVESTITQLLNVLEQREDKSKISNQDRAAIRQVIEGRFDYKTMAKYSMGRPWKKLNKDERTHFTSVFRDFLEYSYGNRLSAYKGQTVTFADAKVIKKKTFVESTVKNGKSNTSILYRVHQTKTGWQIRDISIAGASMVRTFNHDFKPTLDKRGYQGLVKLLEEKVAKLKAKD